MFPHRVICILVITVIFSGCATYESRDLNPQQSRLQLENRRLDDSGLQAFLSLHQQNLSGEWDLEKLTLAAFYFSPVLDLARADYDAAKAGVKATAALPNPSFTFVPGYNVDAASGVSPWILGYVLEFPLDLTGQRIQRTAQARYQEEIAGFNLASAAWAVRHEVVQAFIDLHAAEQASAFWKNQSDLLSQSVTLVENEVQVGEVSDFEARQIRILSNRAEIDARQNNRARSEALIRLAEALGVTSPALEGVTFSYRGLDHPLAETTQKEARAFAAQNRPDLLASLTAYALTESELQREVARQYPDLVIGPGYELDQGEGKWSLSFGFDLPMFDRNKGPIAVATAQREAAAARFLALQNHVLSQVDRAFADYASTHQELETFRSLHSRYDEQVKTLQVGQSVGEVSRLEVFRAKLELADHMSAELDAVRRAEQSLAALEDAIQRPLAWPDTVWSQSPRTAAAP